MSHSFEACLIKDATGQEFSAVRLADEHFEYYFITLGIGPNMFTEKNLLIKNGKIRSEEEVPLPFPFDRSKITLPETSFLTEKLEKVYIQDLKIKNEKSLIKGFTTV